MTSKVVALSDSHRGPSWLTAKIEQGRREAFCEAVDITPEMAARMLELNIDNRKINEKIVGALELDIREGRWQLNGETIIFSDEGPLNDGQNRLMAIVRAEKSARSFVAFGAPRRSRFTVDMGKGRSAGTILELKGVHNAAIVASIANLHLQVIRGDYAAFRIDKVMTADHAETIKDEIFQTMTVFPAWIDAGSRKAAIVAYLLFRKIDAQDATRFFEGFLSGAGLGKSNPILAARNRMLMGFGMNEEARRRPWHKLELLMHYWNKHRRRESVAPGVKLQVTGKFPAIV